jgi:hypothetical protein
MRLSEAYPWVVSFAFCVMHGSGFGFGFGFSDALQGIDPTEIGLAAEPIDFQHPRRGRQNLCARGRRLFNPGSGLRSRHKRDALAFLGLPTWRSLASVFAREGMTRRRLRPSV